MEFVDKYESILAVTKDESVAKGVIQTEALTGIDYKDILKSMGFKPKEND
jgi:hypothetical protein